MLKRCPERRDFSFKKVRGKNLTYEPIGSIFAA